MGGSAIYLPISVLFHASSVVRLVAVQAIAAIRSQLTCSLSVQYVFRGSHSGAGGDPSLVGCHQSTLHHIISTRQDAVRCVVAFLSVLSHVTPQQFVILSLTARLSHINTAVYLNEKMTNVARCWDGDRIKLAHFIVILRTP